MPELPEVETIVRELGEAGIEALTISKAMVFWPRSVNTHDPDAFCKQIAKQKILKVARRGKLIVFILSKDTLLVHLRMTGKFLFAKSDAEHHSHERVRLYLSDGRILRYEDQRKFGKWSLLADAEERLAELGIEPLSEEFTLEAFKAMAQKSSRQAKPFLLDQKNLVGLGNIYVDEALWEAKIHPSRRMSELTNKEIIALHAAIPKVLQLGVDNIGTSLGSKRANYFSVSGRRGSNQHRLNVFRREGQPCPCCSTIITKITLAQRGTHLCPQCQKSDSSPL